jgi:hypothetical protein
VPLPLDREHERLGLAEAANIPASGA